MDAIVPPYSVEGKNSMRREGWIILSKKISNMKNLNKFSQVFGLGLRKRLNVKNKILENEYKDSKWEIE